MLTKVKTIINRHRFEAIFYTIFVTILIVTLVITYVTYPFWLDSDMSAEIIAVKQALEEGGVLSKNWYYGTEFRILTPALIYQFLLLFTNDYWIIRAITIPVVIIILLSSVYFLLKQMGYKKYFPLVGSLFLLPWPKCSSYYVYVISGYQMYSFYLALTFISIGLIIKLNEIKTTKYKILIISVLCIISFLFGLNSPRHIIWLYAPLLATSLLLFLIETFKVGLKDAFISKKGNIGVCLLMLLFNGVALVIYKNVLSLHFHVFSYPFKLEMPTLSKFLQVLQAACGGLGFSYETDSFGIISNIIFILILICIIVYVIFFSTQYKKLTDADKTITFLTLFTFIFIFFTHLFYAGNNTIPTPRYFLLSFIFLFFLVAVVYERGNFNIKRKNLNYVPKIVFTTMLGLCIVTYNNFRFVKCSSVDFYIRGDDFYNQIIKKINTLNYNFGYASHWNGLVLTELTDKHVDMYVWKLNENNDIEENKEVQTTKHDDFVVDKPCFVLFQINETTNNGFNRVSAKYQPTLLTKNYYLFEINSGRDLFF